VERRRGRGVEDEVAKRCAFVEDCEGRRWAEGESSDVRLSEEVMGDARGKWWVRKSRSSIEPKYVSSFLTSGGTSRSRLKICFFN
jgi:hypothetical protein